MTIDDPKFWIGFKAGLDDVERAVLREKIASEPQVMACIAELRKGFGLGPRDDKGRAELPRGVRGISVRDHALEQMVGQGFSEDAANELLTMARRAGREMAEIDTEEEDDELDDSNDS